MNPGNSLSITLTAQWIASVYTFDHTGGEQTFTVPANGYYKLEVWGGQGGNATANGGYGGYAVGVSSLSKGLSLYVNVGGYGNSQNYNGGNGGIYGYTNGGWNGGGAVTPCASGRGGGGGGATHIAKISGALYTYRDNTSQMTNGNLLIVAGGGGGAGNNNKGGNGGGLQGNAGQGDSGYATGGNQAAGGIDRNGALAGFGFGSVSAWVYSSSGAINFCGQGGGGGYYGGGRGFNGNNTAAGGGSGYIGSSNLISGLGITKHMTCYSCTTSTVAATRTNSNTNVSATATADYSKTGNGYARITYLGTSI